MFLKHGVYLVRGGKRTFRHDLWPDYKATEKIVATWPWPIPCAYAEVARERAGATEAGKLSRTT